MNLIYHLLCRYQFSVKGQLSNEMIILNGKVNCKIRMVEIPVHIWEIQYQFSVKNNLGVLK